MNFINVRKKKYISIWVVREQESYSFIKKRRFKPTATTLRFAKGKMKEVDVNFPSFAKGLKLFYFMDVTEGQLVFGKDSMKKKAVNPELLDMVVRQSIIKQLAYSLAGRFGAGLVTLILAFVSGIGAGWIIAGFF